MEDPWANAWGEPAKPSAASRTTWSHSAKPSLGGLDAEADIAVPSWATGAAVQWSEPSEDPATIWHPNLAPAKEWVTSPYEDLPLGKSVSNPIPQRDRSPSPEHAQTTPSSPRSAPVSPKLPLEYTPPTHDVLPPEDHSSTPISAPASPPGTPDAFGTFETGIHAVQDDLDPWAQSVVPPDTHKADGQEEDLWAPSWGASDSATEIGSSDKPVDEWEAAKQRKAKQDQHVPPHVLASILDEFRALSKELWPSSSDEETVGANGRRSGIDNVEGLAAIENRLIPQDLTLPQYVHFSKTFTSKHMGESLRLTRHVPITRLSPFTLYLASKGSTAWETSVKSRVEVAADDLLPPGWRVVEKDKEETKPTIDTKKKGSGGLLSFFGRRAPATPSESNSRRSESPGRTQPASTFLGVSSTSATSPVVAVTPPNTESSKPVGAGPSTPVAIASPPSTSASSGTTSTSTPAVQPSQPTSDVSEPALAPSAVSRFLNRFSRGKSSGTSARNSLALSTEDLEFLSDIVPSANDEVDEDAQLQQLSTMISSSPLPTKLPPALAPPPRPPPPPRAASNASSITHERLPPPPDTHDDLFSLFNSPPSSGQSSAPALQPVPSAFSRPPSQSSAASSAIPPLPPPIPTSFKIEPQPTGSSLSSRGAGRPSSPFDFAGQSKSRSQSPLPATRTPIAIMSTGSTSSTNSSGFHNPLPPPPILPPPPNPKPPSQPPSRLPSENIVADDFADFYSPPPPQPLQSDTSISSVFSDESLFANSSNRSVQSNNDFFDDFDDFVSSPIRDPSPPRPPAKPASFGHQPISQPIQVLPQPPTKHPSQPSQKVSRAADHRRTTSLLDAAAARPGKWPAAPPPFPGALPPPGTTQPGTGPAVQAKQGNGSVLGPSASTLSVSPFSIPPPPGFAPMRTITMSPSPPPLLPPANVSAQSRIPQLLLPQKSAASSPAPSTAGGLSAQDLSFFEGL